MEIYLETADLVFSHHLNSHLEIIVVIMDFGKSKVNLFQDLNKKQP
jgi:hypothetical protein